MAEDTQELGVPDPIDDPVEDIRVFTEEDAKLYRARAVLARFDSEVYDLADATIQFQSPVPVITDDGTRIGFASVFFDGERMLGDITIDYASPERLLAETQAMKLYARPYGSLHVNASPMFDFQAKVQVTRISVAGIVLSTKKPSGDRVSPFGSTVI